MVIMFLLFGYQKWFEYEAQVLIPYISNGPLISWMYPVFGVRGASWFLGVSEWLFSALLFLGFWGRARLMCYVPDDRHHHSIHAGWLGCVGRRISGDDRKRSVPDEGHRAVRGIGLFAEAGCDEGFAERAPT